MDIEILVPTDFPLDVNDPLARFHHLINTYLLRILSELVVDISALNTDWEKIWGISREAATEILELPIADQLGCMRACARFSYWSRFEWGWSVQKEEDRRTQSGYESCLINLCRHILTDSRDWTQEEIKELMEIPTPYPFRKEGAITLIVESYVARRAITSSFRETAETVRDWNAGASTLSHWLMLGVALGETVVLRRGEKWADNATTFILQQPEEVQDQWREFLLHCIQPDQEKPNKKWLKAAKTCLDKIGHEEVERCFWNWCADFAKHSPSYALNQEVFKGLVWSASLFSSDKTASALSDLALHFEQHKTSVSAPDVTFNFNLFNVCVWSLTELNNPTVAIHLRALKEATPNKIRLKLIEKSLQTIAAR